MDAPTNNHAPVSGPATKGGTELASAWMAPPDTFHATTRMLRYLRSMDFYSGEHWDTQQAEGEKRLTLNYARVFVNKAASYLLSRPVTYDAEAPKEITAAEQREEIARQVEGYLARVGEFNGLAAVDLDTAIQAGVLGDGAYTVRWDAVAGMPRVTQVDPRGLDARWRADDNRTLLWVGQQYWVMPAELSEAQYAKLVEGVMQVDDYRPLRAREEWTEKEWRLYVSEVQVDGGANPYGVIPYVIFPNLRVPGEFWGESDLVDLIEINQELNRRMSVFSLILDIAGNPTAVISGATPEDTATLRLGPNQLWTIPADAKAYVLDLLEKGGAAAHVQYIESLYRAMHDITEMPRTSFGDSSGQSQARSGTALEIELQPLLHKLARKTAILTRAFLDRAQLILRMARLHGEELPEAALTVVWPPVLPQDREALVSQEVRLVGAGIHAPTQAMGLLGAADPDPVFEKVLEEGKRLAEIGVKVGGGGQQPSTGGVNATRMAGEAAASAPVQSGSAM